MHCINQDAFSVAFITSKTAKTWSETVREWHFFKKYCAT